MTAIELRDVVKTFGPVRALDGLHLSVEAGEVHGFLGPNGAGKSTAIRVLLGVLRATAGSAQVLGMDPWRDSVELHHRLAVPIKAEPAHAFQDRVDRRLGRSGAIGVLDAEQELAAMMPREQPVKQRGARAAQMEIAGRRRREAGDDGHGPRL